MCFPPALKFFLAQKPRKGPPMIYYEKLKEAYKLHWKEIVTLSVALHWVMDMILIGPIAFFMGVMFGVHMEVH